MNNSNWHWTQKDITQWAFSFLREKLSGDSFSDPEGDVTICMRKGNLRCIFDLSFSLSILDDCGKDARLKFEDVLSDCIDEVSCTVTPSSASVARERRERYCDRVKGCVSELIREAFLVHGGDAGDERPPSAEKGRERSHPQPTGLSKQAPEGRGNFAVTDWSGSVSFSSVPAELIWQAIFNAEVLRRWSGDEGCVADCVVGGGFKIFGGSLSGTFTSVSAERHEARLRLRCFGWPEEHHCDCTISISSDNCGYTLKISEHGVPSADFESNRLNWKNRIFSPLCTFFGQSQVSDF